MIALIEQHRAELVETCRRYRVRRLALFGSAVKGQLRDESSDLDFVIVLEGAGEPGYATRYYEFAEALASLFRRKVDLLTERMIGNPDFDQELERTCQTVHEQGGDDLTPGSRMSHVDAIADQIVQQMTAYGESLESMLQTLRDLRAESA